MQVCVARSISLVLGTMLLKMKVRHNMQNMGLRKYTHVGDTVGGEVGFIVGDLVGVVVGCRR